MVLHYLRWAVVAGWPTISETSKFQLLKIINFRLPYLHNQLCDWHKPELIFKPLFWRIMICCPYCAVVASWPTISEVSKFQLKEITNFRSVYLHNQLCDWHELELILKPLLWRMVLHYLCCTGVAGWPTISEATKFQLLEITKLGSLYLHNHLCDWHEPKLILKPVFWRMVLHCQRCIVVAGWPTVSETSKFRLLKIINFRSSYLHNP